MRGESSFNHKCAALFRVAMEVFKVDSTQTQGDLVLMRHEWKHFRNRAPGVNITVNLKYIVGPLNLFIYLFIY